MSSFLRLKLSLSTRSALPILCFGIALTSGCAIAAEPANTAGAKAGAGSEGSMSSGPLVEAFGGFAAPAGDAPARNLSGDFNGDGQLDRLIWLSVHDSGHQLPVDTSIVRPWPYEGADQTSTSFEPGAKRGLGIVHCQPGTVDDCELQRAFVVHDRDPVSILATEAATELLVVSKAALAEEEGVSEVIERARGDVIVLPTEAGIDTYLYWDGQTYQAYEPLELP